MPRIRTRPLYERLHKTGREGWFDVRDIELSTSIEDGVVVVWFYNRGGRKMGVQLELLPETIEAIASWWEYEKPYFIQERKHKE